MYTKAIQKCESYRKAGYACSESVARTLEDLYQLNYPVEVHKAMSVFAGGAIDDGRCGVLEAGLLTIAVLYDQKMFEETISLEEISLEMHNAFEKIYGGYQCRDIFYPLYDAHKRSGEKEEGFHCAFHDGLVIAVKIIEAHKKGK